MLTKQEIINLKRAKLNLLSPEYLYSDRDIDTLLKFSLRNEAHILEGLIFEKGAQAHNNNAILGTNLIDAYFNANELPIVIPIKLVSQSEIKEAENAKQSSGKHWISLIIFPELKEILPKVIISNPFGNGLGEEFDLTYRVDAPIKLITFKLIELGRFLQYLLQDHGIEASASQFIITGIVRQKNSYDCGPHVVQTIIETIRHIPYYQVNSETKEGVRLRKQHTKILDQVISNNKPNRPLSFCGINFTFNKSINSKAWSLIHKSHS